MIILTSDYTSVIRLFTYLKLKICASVCIIHLRAGKAVKRCKADTFTPLYTSAALPPYCLQTRQCQQTIIITKKWHFRLQRRPGKECCHRTAAPRPSRPPAPRRPHSGRSARPAPPEGGRAEPRPHGPQPAQAGPHPAAAPEGPR